MKLQSLKVLLMGAALAFATTTPALAADDAAEPKAQDQTADKDKSDVDTKVKEADIEKRLEAARERLEAAAREVAELSGELSGPLMARTMHPPRAMIGVGLADEDPKDGAKIESVTPKGPADKAGLKTGDVITAVSGKKLAGGEDRPSLALVKRMREFKPGDKIQVEYLRDGKTTKADVVTEDLRGKRYAMRMMPPIPPVPPVPPVPGVPETRHGAWHQGMLDMELVTLTPKLGAYFGTDHGVLVVRAPSKADLKLEEGDVIVDIGGRVPQSGGHAMRILRSYQAGEKVTLNILRNKKSMKLEVTMPKDDGMDFGSFFPEMLMEPAAPAAAPAPPAPPRPAEPSST